MPLSPSVSTVGVLGSDGPAVANVLNDVSLLPHYSDITFPRGYFGSPGQTGEAHAFGRISGVAPATLTLKIKLGSVVVAETQPLPMPETQQIDTTWCLRWWFQQRTVKKNATFMHTGLFTSSFLNTPVPDVAPHVGEVFDATAQQRLDITAAWDIADPSNSIQLQLAVLKMLN